MRILFKLSQYNQQRQHEKLTWIFPIYLAMYATALRNQGNEICWDTMGTEVLKSEHWDKIITSESQIDIPFLKLPHADRILTNAKNPKWQRNGNFKYLPGCYLMSASGCWWSKCSFCVEKSNYEVRPVEDVISEIEECKALGYRECFDDSATFPVGNWSDSFCGGLIERRNKLVLGCNMRMVNADFLQMKAAGFRNLLFGLESANEITLNRINKGTKVGDIEYIIKASKYGLEPHIAAIVGFPWEDYDDTMRTINLVKWLLVKGYAKTAQMSFYTPPKNQEQGNEEYRKYVTKFYEVGFYPEFWYNRLINIKSMDDLNYLIKGVQKGFSALLTRRLT